jgi:hypothetical protein
MVKEKSIVPSCQQPGEATLKLPRSRLNRATLSPPRLKEPVKNSIEIRLT